MYMLRRDDVENKVQYRIEELCRNTQMYLNVFKNACPFNSRQLRLHVQTINLRRELGNVGTALRNDNFITSLWKTLEAWGLNARGSRLLPLEKFRQVLLDYEGDIVRWDGIRIDNASLLLEEVAQDLWELIDEVRVSESGNPIVSGSKAFHHLLPELIPPIDREYTRPFFMFWMQYFQNEPHRVFPYIWGKIALMTRRVNLRQYIGLTGWSTSITKVLDNAIIGYCKHHIVPKLR